MKVLKIKTLLFFFVTSLLIFSCSSDIESEETQLDLTNIEAEIKAKTLQEKIEGMSKPGDTGPNDGGCHSTKTELVAADRDITYTANSETLYSIRDNFLANYSRGIRYIDEYYYTSNVVKDYTNLSSQTIYNVIDLMPYIYDAFDNIKDPNYTGVIVNNSLKTKLIDVLNGYKVLSTDAKYKVIIDDLISDVNFVTNKNKSEVIDFMNN